MAIKDELIGIAGAGNVFDDAESLKPYAKDNSLSEPGMPGYIVKPKSVEEVQKIVILANKNKLPVVRVSADQLHPRQ